MRGRTVLLGVVLVAATGCANAGSAGTEGSGGNAYCQHGWTTLDSVVALPDGTAMAGGATCSGDAEHSLLRSWDGASWSDVPVDDVSELSDLESDGSTVWALGGAPEPWRPGSSLLRIDGGGAAFAHAFDAKMSDLAIAPDGGGWLSGFWRPTSGDGPAADHASPTIVHEVAGTWVDTGFGGVTTANGGNWTEAPTIVFVGRTPYAAGVAFEEESPFPYLLRWDGDTWQQIRVPKDVPASDAVASTGSQLVLAGVASDGGAPILATYDPAAGWSTEPIATGHATGRWFAVAADAARIWVVSADGDPNEPMPWAAVRTGTGWTSVPVGVDPGTALADVAILPDGSAIAVGADCCRGDLPRDAVTVHLSA